MKTLGVGLKFYLASVFFIFSGAQITVAQDVSNPELRAELLKRREQDQAARAEWIKKGVSHPDKATTHRIAAIDKDNREWLKKVVQKYCWPTNKLVGQDGSRAAFLLVQHADPDPKFQRQMLPHVEAAYKSGELPGADYAFLLDRVLLYQGKPQVYGTQAENVKKWKGKEPVMAPIADEANVDNRRAEVGLPPLAEYKTTLKKHYFPEENKQPESTVPAPGSDAPAQVVRARDAWLAAFLSKELDKTLSFYESGAAFLQPSGERIEGIDQIRNLYQKVLGTFDSQLTLRSRGVEVSGALAYDSGEFDEVLTTIATGPNPEGGANSQQQLGSGSNSTSPPAASGRSP